MNFLYTFINNNSIWRILSLLRTSQSRERPLSSLILHSIGYLKTLFAIPKFSKLYKILLTIQIQVSSINYSHMHLKTYNIQLSLTLTIIQCKFQKKFTFQFKYTTMHLILTTKILLTLNLLQEEILEVTKEPILMLTKLEGVQEALSIWSA